VKPNEHRIRRAFEHIEHQRVRAIFAGHSHYDHIADIPTIARLYMPKVPIHVNAMGTRALAGEGLDVHELVVGKPVDAGSIRVRAVSSGHAPQICKWRRFPCVYAGREIDANWTTPLTKHRLVRMHGGQPLALVIELLDSDRESYRIYYNDSSPDSPLGQTTGRFDLAILTIAQWHWARDYPRDLLSVLRPDHVVISHWDNFFTEATQTSRAIPFLTTKKVSGFTDIVDTYVTTTDAGPVSEVCGKKSEKWTMPAPASTMLFNPR
jgi:L-ascorbate metabolism protein UlaG (beta-lactamase superfamily)